MPKQLHNDKFVGCKMLDFSFQCNEELTFYAVKYSNKKWKSPLPYLSLQLPICRWAWTPFWGLWEPLSFSSLALAGGLGHLQPLLLLHPVTDCIILVNLNHPNNEAMTMAFYEKISKDLHRGRAAFCCMLFDKGGAGSKPLPISFFCLSSIVIIGFIWESKSAHLSRCRDDSISRVCGSRHSLCRVGFSPLHILLWRGNSKRGVLR